MGVVYGAGSLWQWVLHPGEPGQAAQFTAEGAGWREALDFEGSTYVGLVGRILAGLPIIDMQPDWQSTLCPRGLCVPGLLYIGYAEHGGPLRMFDGENLPRHYRVIDPRTGAVLDEGKREDPADPVPAEYGAPLVYVLHDGE
jgi:hypothetical protein